MRNGCDEKLPNGGHSAQTVYTEMYIQVLRDYPSLPDVRTIVAHEIRFFYNGLRNELKEHTKAK